MGIYISTKGLKRETEEMPIEYLRNSLEVAKRNNHPENIKALEEEIKKRNAH
mgnify:CR=1 FL=1